MRHSKAIFQNNIADVAFKDADSMIQCTGSGKQSWRFTFLLITVAYAQMAFAQVPAPVNFCGSVNQLNAFVMTWEEPAGADPMLNYEIYRDNGNGFVMINLQGPSNNTTFTDFGLDVTELTRYYVRSVFNGEASANTNIIGNIVLNLNASVPSVAQLIWNQPYDPMPQEGNFVVYRRPQDAAEVAVANLPSTAMAYNDTLFAFCQDSLVSYRVVHESTTCNASSQLQANEFRDLMPPPQPLIETAIVDPFSGDISVFWYASNAPDLAFYRIQDIDIIGQQFVNVGVVNAGDPEEFVYENAGLTTTKTLAVIAFDGCGNDASFGLTATTMLAEASYSECSLDAMVSWSPYIGWPEGVDSYLIKAQIDGAAPVVLGQAEGSSTFQLVEVEPNKQYCFFVEAVSSGTQRNSTSNVDCVTTNYPTISTFAYLSTVNVLSNTSLEVRILQDQQSVGTTFKLFRARQTSAFVPLGTFEQGVGPEFIYVDEGLDTRSVNYRYKWEVYDGCGDLIGTTNIGTNIVLDAIAETRELKNYLNWSAYEEWENGVDAYQIWRKVGSDDEFALYDEVAGSTLIFEDDVEQFRDQGGEFCYRVVAIEGENSYGISSTSQSYTDCVTQPPIMWIPSAIVIDGQPDNQIFKPVAGFIDLDSYRMEIYNKWGQLLFESQSVEDGWDGTFKGNVVREDFYRYIIAYRDGSGKPYVEQDVLYVLKK